MSRHFLCLSLRLNRLSNYTNSQCCTGFDSPWCEQTHIFTLSSASCQTTAICFTAAGFQDCIAGLVTDAGQPVCGGMHVNRLQHHTLDHVVQGTICCAAMWRIRHVLSNKLGRPCGQALLIITAVQFHLPFYMSRTLPNTFATAVLGFAIADWLDGRHPRRLVALLAFGTVS